MSCLWIRSDLEDGSNSGDEPNTIADFPEQPVIEEVPARPVVSACPPPQAVASEWARV
jgi:hypothetical protein